MQLFLLLCNTRSSNSAAMGCSHRKLSETGLRIPGVFLKVKLCVGARRSTGSGASIPDDNRIQGFPNVHELCVYDTWDSGFDYAYSVEYGKKKYAENSIVNYNAMVNVPLNDLFALRATYSKSLEIKDQTSERDITILCTS